MAASLSRFCRTTTYIVAMMGLAVMTSSCQMAKNQLQYDRTADMDRQDYRDALAPAPLPPEDKTSAPAFQSVLATPEDLKLPSPLVTVSVNQTVSLRDLMFELAKQANVDLELDPQIHGSLIFTAKDRPFDEVVDRLCTMAGLRYKFENNVLRVELDRPYIKTYSIDYLNVTRKSTSSVKTDISLSTAAGSTATSSGGGGSTSSIDTDIGGDMWKELGDNIEQILTSSDTYISLATLADPVTTPLNPNPVPAPVSADPNTPPPPPLPGSAQVAPMPAAAAPTLSVATPPGEPLVPSPPATYSISKATGSISVFANQRQQKLVGKFLDNYRKRATTEVLIEAKILQVDLNDEFSAGIDWNLLQDKANGGGIVNAFPTAGLTPAAAGSFFSGTFSFGRGFNGAVQAVSRFGTVRALSSPRVTVLNNQPAVVNVAQNNVYFKFDVQTEKDTTSNTNTTTINSNQESVPDGVLLNVIPTANPDTGEIMLVVRPTVSKITSYVTDPTIALTLANNGQDPTATGVPSNQIPQVSVQEIDSMLKMQSGQMMVMGGLMKDSNTVQDLGLPVMGDIPLLGYLFKNHADHAEKSELVILIRASIVNGNNADDADRKVYTTFGQDRRPARM